MNRIKFFAAVLLALFAVSCKKDISPEPGYQSFVTVNMANGRVSNFVTDDGRTLVPQNKSLAFNDGQRLLIFFSLVNQADKDKENAEIKLFSFDRDVQIGNSVKVQTEEEARQIGNNGTSINLYPNTPVVTPKYFNFYLGFNAQKPEKHLFSLAHIADNSDSSRVLSLTLCHDDQGDSSPSVWWTWLSFPVEEFAEQLKGKEKVRIYIRTRVEGTRTIELPVPVLGDAPAVNMTALAY